MTGRDVFKIWSPVNAKWVDWVRPVPFVSINDSHDSKEIYNFTIPEINYINELLEDTAVFLDLAGYDAIKEGIALSKTGFRPIPLYNGTNEQTGAMAIIDNRAIEYALVWGASEIKKIAIPENAPPAFLLDSNRMHRFKMNDSVFDNSWDLYPQDIPSAEYFLNNGINKIIIRSAKIQKDLIKIFYKFQKKGISFFFTDGYESPKKVVLKKPLSNLFRRDD